jgi:hypothetical protein
MMLQMIQSLVQTMFAIMTVRHYWLKVHWPIGAALRYASYRNASPKRRIFVLA